jgi:hypothetical protein
LQKTLRIAEDTQDCRRHSVLKKAQVLVKGLLGDKDKELLGNEELRAELMEKMTPVSVDSITET